MKFRLTVATLIFTAASAFANNVTGYVFDDANRNGKMDRGEKGIASVSVSNGIQVVQTDAAGRYTLPIDDDQIIFVVKPAGYQVPMNHLNLPQFYYNHKPNGSPAGFKYEGVKPTGKLPKNINFALHRQQENPNFEILVFGDPQPYNLRELDYFRRAIVDEVKTNKKNAVFGITLGDLVGDDLTLHPQYAQVMKEIGLPWYNVMGNHDMNYEAKEDRHSDESFEKTFGPSTYSFNYADVHFIILDDILYPDPRDGKGYYGGFRPDQLEFIKNDLKFVDKNKLVVLAFHIQMEPERPGEDHFRMEDRKALFDILQPYENILMMSAHTHKQSQLFYTKDHGWQGAKDLHEINMGTTSGDWFSGTANERGLPKSMMRDGTEQGYSFVNFSGNKYKIQYKVAGKPENYQIKLYVPKVVQNVRNNASIVANFFSGSKNDSVEYRIDGGEWKPMQYAETFDPEYIQSVLKWDTTETLYAGRRPSYPENSRHIWVARFPKLENGEHRVEVRAKDLYGDTHTANAQFTVSELKPIP